MPTVQNSINAPIPFAASKGGTGVVSPTAHTIPIAQGSSPFTFLGPLTDGQLLIGNSGGNPVPGVLTEGSGISITNTAGSVVIAATGVGTGFQVITGNTALVADNEYAVNDASGNPILTLPTTASAGTEIIIDIYTAVASWTIAQNSGQSIQFGNAITTTGAAGSLSGNTIGDSVTLVCLVANTLWFAKGAVGGEIIVT